MAKPWKLPKKSFKKGDLPETEEEWVRYINRMHDTGLMRRQRYEWQWVVNECYYKGYQHLMYNRQTGGISIPNDFSQPLTINRIGSFIDSRHAKITKQRPAARVIPNDNDPEDIYAAKNADRALMHLWRKIDMESEQDKLASLMLLHGDAFMETAWDPNTGDVIKDYKKANDGQDLVMEEDGTLAMEKIFMGEVSTKALSAFSIIPASESTPGIPDQEWIIKRTHTSVLAAEEIYEHLRGQLSHKDSESQYTQHEKIVQRLASPIFNGVGVGVDMANDAMNAQCLLKTFYMKPNYQYEKGVLAVVCGAQLCWIGEWPNDWGTKNVYPIVKFSERPGVASFWSQATLERLISVQKAYNRLRQQEAKNAALMANLKWALPKGSGVAEDALNDEEGEVVEYNPSVPAPSPIQMPPMPNYVAQLAQDLITDFRDAGGQRESSITPPPNIVAGVAMQVSAEMADEIIGPIIKRWGSSLERVAEQQLLVMDQEWTEPRLVKIFGEGGKISTEWLTAADFRHHTDVHIEVESMYPEFRGSKRQTLMELWDRRIIQDPIQVLKAFKYGNWDSILEPKEKAEESVLLDIANMKRGKEPEIAPYQNHMLYVEKISDWIQTPEFLRLIPERKQMVIQVLQAHTQMLMQQMPQMGQPMGQQNQAAVNTPMGASKTVGSPESGVEPQGGM